MIDLHLRRRAFLKSVGAGAIALPFLNTLAAPARAQATAAKPRLVVFFSPNGTIPSEWIPDGGETDFSLRRILKPLERHRARLLILQGLDMLSTGPGDGHQQGMGGMLTGTDLLPGSTMGGCDTCPAVSWAGGLSIDQLIANRISADRPFKSLELGALTGGNDVWTRMIYKAAGQPMPPDDDPYRVFTRVFGSVNTTQNAARDRRLFLGKSVLDAVQTEFGQLGAQLGSADRQQLESHLESVRAIEKRLYAADTGAICAVPSLGSMLDARATQNYPSLVKLQMDIASAALACDLTRVVSLQWSASVGQVPAPWLGISERHHDLSHEGDSNTDAVDKLVKINAWYAEQFAYLLDKLAAVKEGDGSMLDNTLVLWCNELGKGNSHTRNDAPFVLAGNVNGYFRTGRYLQIDRKHNALFVSLANAFGIDTNTFGDPARGSGPLPNLR
jgi:hypothetical protein